ncbi:MaoC family dehydratase [Azospirillum thermophilum]|uniref:Dehydratase n=1 Tax=Azospirillum thermophilum TaxID=2202148 RepID=A0A2S2CQJ1_9PROT|nr:MaoC family dehydratase [Azospirillum thermophilum]AWK86793.1 dehydratase [Azospirillum thermophilum]
MRYLEDLKVGDRFAGSSSRTVTADEIVAFAGNYDPQPFHLDEDAARDSLFGGLAASGWHTAALTMRMIVDGETRLAGGYIGLGVESVSWPRPTRPGDRLRIESEVLELRESGKRPDSGVARIRTVTFNQKDEVVMTMVANLLVPRRPATPAGVEAALPG